MSETRHLGIVVTAFVAVLVLAGCSHAVFPSTTTTGGTNPLILTIHDTPPNDTTVTSFEVTVTGAVLQPGNVSLISSPQTVELTQLQINSFLLAETSQAPAGTYTSLEITYSSPQYTFINDTGGSVTIGTLTCNAGASCVVSSPTASVLTDTVNFSSGITVGQNQTLLEFDVNLNNVIQSDYSLNFGDSGAVTVTQSTNSSGTTTLGTMEVAGQVGLVDASSSQFALTASTGQSFTITAGSGTIFEFARASCTDNNFTCIAAGQIVDVTVDIQSDGATLDAGEIDYDDASGTQQVSGTIVAENGAPPTSFTLVVHNTDPAVSTVPVGTPLTVTISNTASYFINNGSFLLPTGVSFASTSDIIVGQEVEARVESGTSITNNAFTTDRLALEQTQLQAAVSSISSQASPFPFFVLSPLPALYSSASVGSSLQFEVVDTSSQAGTGVTGTVYQDLSPANITSLTDLEPLTVGGFLFNTTSTVGSPSIIATVVRGEVTGT